MDKDAQKMDSDPNFDFVELHRNAPCGYMITDINGDIISLNEFIWKWLGFESKDQFKKNKFQEMLSAGSRLFYETQHLPLVKIQNSASEINYKLTDRDGKKMDVLVNSVLIRDESNAPIQIHHVIFPFSDRKKYEKDLILARKKAEQSSMAKSNFMSTITHEIRTPIHTVLGISDLLIQENPREDQLDMLQLLQVSSLNLLELINSILEYNKIEAGKIELLENPIDLHRILEDLVGIYRTQAKLKGIEINLRISKDTPRYFLGDSVKINQIMTNLLGNSLKFTINGKIEINLTSKNDLLNKRYLEFEVRDTGIGMSNKEVKAIFEPFAQANDTIHKKFGGSGMGLSITQKLLKAYDSNLEVESTKGQGSIFKFGLRLKECDPPKKLDHKTNLEELEKLSGMHVLVVDDSLSNHFIVKRILKKWDVSYYLANGGIEALKVIEKQEFDIILMDLNMPGIDGYETAQKIRLKSNDRLKKIPIIAYSAASSKSLTPKMKKAGMNDLILKPFRAEKLHGLLKKYQQNHSGNESVKTNDAVNETITIAIFDSKIENVVKTFENDTVVIDKYLKAVLKDIQNIKTKLVNFKSNSELSKKSFEAIQHSTKTICRMFELHDLVTLFESGKTKLLKNKVEDFMFTIEEIIRFMDDFSIWVKEQIDK